MMNEPFEGCEIIKGRLYFAVVKRPPSDTSRRHYFQTDTTLQYEPFFKDFGPLNLGLLYRFCKTLNAKLKSDKYKDKQIVYYCAAKPQRVANSAALIGQWQVIYNQASPEQAYRPLKAFEPYIPFRDAAQGNCTYKLSVLHTIKAVAKAVKFNLFDFKTFDVEEYEYFECVESGDLNMIVPGKFLAFASPHSTRVSPDGYPLLTPEDYFPIWEKFDVKCIIRLNRKTYDRADFIKAGYRHHDLFFIDGTTPSTSILKKFLKIVEDENELIAIHCKAGLGRTGTLMGCWMMKHLKMTAAETIAWIRLCRPGSVIGPQQHYLKMMEPVMWKAGREMREKARAAFEASASGNSSSNGAAPTPKIDDDEEEAAAGEEDEGMSHKGPAMFSAEERKAKGSAPPTPDRPRPSRPAISPSHFPNSSSKPKVPVITSGKGKQLKF